MKRLLAAWLPEAVKAPLRGRLYGYRGAGADLGYRYDAATETAHFADGLALRLPPEVVPDLEYHLRNNGASIEEMHGFVRHGRRRGGLLLDVGAHHGLFSAVFCALDPAHLAVAYEPSPELGEVSARLFALNGLASRITPRRALVGDTVGRVGSWVDRQGFIRTDPAPAGVTNEPAEATTLDADCAARGLSPSMVKIDVEGDELRVLRGARQVLREHRPVLFIELHLDLLERRGDDVREIHEIVSGAGYRWESSLGHRLSARQVVGSAAAVLRVVAVP